MSESIAALQQQPIRTVAPERLPEALRIAREILANPDVSPYVRDIAASVIRRHGTPLDLDS